MQFAHTTMVHPEATKSGVKVFCGFSQASSDCSTDLPGDSSSCSEQKFPELPQMPRSEFWNLVVEKNTFLCLAEDEAKHDEFNPEQRRSCSCPPRLEADDVSKAPSSAFRSGSQASRSSGDSERFDMVGCASADASTCGPPCANSPTPSPSGDITDGAGLSAPAPCKHASISRTPRKQQAREQNQTKQMEDSAGGARVDADSACQGMHGQVHPDEQAGRLTPASMGCPKSSSSRRSRAISDPVPSLGTANAGCGIPRAQCSGPASAKQKPRPRSTASAQQSEAAAAKVFRGDGVRVADVTGVVKVAVPQTGKQSQHKRKGRGHEHVAVRSHENVRKRWSSPVASLVKSLCACTLIAVALHCFAMRVPREPSNSDRCWSKPFNTQSIYSSFYREQHDVDRALPVVTLYAPCPLTSFVKVAHAYRSAALEWKYVQTKDMKQLVVHRRDDMKVTWQEGIEQEELLRARIRSVNPPAVGMLTHANFHLYASHTVAYGAGLVTFFPEPGMDGAGFDETYREMLSSVHQDWSHKYAFAYILSGKHPDWVASEFGVKKFPSIVVHKVFPGKPSVYSGDMSEASVRLLLQDASKGCLQYQADPMRAVFQKPEQPMCDAAPVVGISVADLENM